MLIGLLFIKVLGAAVLAIFVNNINQPSISQKESGVSKLKNHQNIECIKNSRFYQTFKRWHYKDFGDDRESLIKSIIFLLYRNLTNQRSEIYRIFCEKVKEISSEDKDKIEILNESKNIIKDILKFDNLEERQLNCLVAAFKIIITKKQHQIKKEPERFKPMVAPKEIHEATIQDANDHAKPTDTIFSTISRLFKIDIDIISCEDNNDIGECEMLCITDKFMPDRLYIIQNPNGQFQPIFKK